MRLGTVFLYSCIYCSGSFMMRLRVLTKPFIVFLLAHLLLGKELAVARIRTRPLVISFWVKALRKMHTSFEKKSNVDLDMLIAK